MNTYELADAENRRRAQIDLCVKCRQFHPLAPDDFRHQYVRQATNGRTSSSKEATLDELLAAAELVGPVPPPDEEHVLAAAKRDAQVPDYWARVNVYDENGQLPFSRPRR